MGLRGFQDNLGYRQTLSQKTKQIKNKQKSLVIYFQGKITLLVYFLEFTEFKMNRLLRVRSENHKCPEYGASCL